MNITIKDIARLAGVSINTVSRALNDKADVNPQTKEKIKRIAHEMNYTPNSLAQGLKSKRSQVLGVVVTNIDNPFYGEIIREVESVARKHDYYLMLCNTSEDRQKELEALTLLKSRVDGVLITPVTADEETVQFLQDINLPFVILNRVPVNSSNVDYVVTDNIKGAYLAIKHFQEKAIQTVHFIAGPKNLYTVNQRYEGCMKAIHEIPSSEKLSLITHHIPLSMNACYEKTMEILEVKPKNKIGIFAYNDNLAIGAMKAIREKGYRIPEDIALMGYDDIRYASMLEVPLTTIRQSGAEIGERGATILIENIQTIKKRKTSSSVILEPELIVRGST